MRRFHRASTAGAMKRPGCNSPTGGARAAVYRVSQGLSRRDMVSICSTATIRRMAGPAPTMENQPLDPHTADFLREAAGAKFDFHRISVKAAGDERLKRAVGGAVMRQHSARQLQILELPDSDKLRTLAGDI